MQVEEAEVKEVELRNVPLGSLIEEAGSTYITGKLNATDTNPVVTNVENGKSHIMPRDYIVRYFPNAKIVIPNLR